MSDQQPPNDPQQPWTPPPPPQYGQPQGQPQQPYGQPQYQQGYPAQPGYGYTPPPPTSSRATMAMILGICGIFVCPGVLSIPAWIIGRGALREIDASNGQVGGRSQAQVGYILGIVGTVLMILAVVLIVVLVVVGATMSCSSTSTDTSWSFHCS